MGMFLIEKGVACKVIRNNVDWYPENFMPFTTTKVNCFDKSEMILDPVGKLGCCQNDHIIGGALELAGYYGFRKENFTLIVPGNKVVYG